MRNLKLADWAIFIALAICLVVLLTGCSAEKQFSRILKKHPEFAKTTIVKEVHRDTLISKEIHKDSTIHNIYSRDTVVIHENRLTIKYLYKGGDSAYLGGKVLPDTLIRIDTLRIPVKTLIDHVPYPLSGYDNFCRWIVGIILIVAALYFGGKYLLPLIIKAIKGGI